ncbi:hypothetical protein GRI58_12570 [Porphyrobacter algicida]|uniref:Uncharacterized protein n=1 Tax=Qipengyuania algicida TaxID=1836209 RepID=A0A845ARY6_9SPHN|nr:hypothetical protein [Qipengyuania algicida]MXP29648.1 hypothetical protein [Qipengyuania algicida]
MAIALIMASPAHAGVYMRLAKASGGSGGAAGTACGAAEDARHDQWIELVSVGSVLERSARRGEAGRVLAKVRGSKAAGTVRSLMECGDKLQLTIRDGKHKYLLSGVSIRKTLRDPANRERADPVETFQLTFGKVEITHESRR